MKNKLPPPRHLAKYCACSSSDVGESGAGLDVTIAGVPHEVCLADRLSDLSTFAGMKTIQGDTVVFFEHVGDRWIRLYPNKLEELYRAESYVDPDPTGKNVICFYHKNCYDGMGAAWAVWKRYPDAQFFALDYGDQIPCDIGPQHTLIIVDFSFSAKVMDNLTDLCDRLIFLDHHKASRPVFEYLRDRQERSSENAPIKKDYYQHTLLESGAGMAWRYFHPGQRVPAILTHIEDRDLWLFSYEDTKAVIAGLSQHPLELEKWKYLLAVPDAVDIFRTQGGAILNKQESEIEWILKTTRREITLDCGNDQQWTVPLIMAPHYIKSEALDRLVEDWPFAVSYYDTEHERVFSLRSQKDAVHAIDVDGIAKRYGGGGHTHAASFKVPRSHELAQL